MGTEYLIKYVLVLNRVLVWLSRPPSDKMLVTLAWAPELGFIDSLNELIPDVDAFVSLRIGIPCPFLASYGDPEEVFLALQVMDS